MLDTIKSYLVGLGFDVDQKSYDNTQKVISDTEKKLSDFAGTSAKSFLKAGAAVTAFFAGASVAVAGFLSKMATSDLQNEMLARQLWTSKENAEAFDKSLKALGVSLEQLYLSPELAHRFRELRAQVNDLRPPPEFRNQMKLIRDIQFEFSRFKLSAHYALQWVGHYLIKYLSGPLNDAHKKLRDFNDRFMKEMPIWAERAGRFLASFINAGRHVLQFFGDMRKRISDLLDDIPTNVKGVAGALGGLALLLRMGPFGMLIGVLTLAILLIDDFYGHLEGKESALGPMWDKLLEFKNNLAETGDLDRLKESFDGLMGSLSDVLSALGEIAMALTGEDNIPDAMAKLGNLGLDGLVAALKLVSGLLDNIALAIKSISSMLKGEFGEFIKGNLDRVREKRIAGEEIDESDAVWDKALNFELGGKIAGQSGRGIFESMGLGIKGIWNRLTGASDNSTSAASTMGVEQMKRLVDDTKSGNRTLDKIADSSKLLTNISSGINNVAMLLAMNSSNGFGYSYSYPQYYNSNSSRFTVNQTNNIYGSDPRATANAVNDNTVVLARNLRGWG